ncbi:hypothetical protein BpHYR1_051089 [Brachionus plicatilis]|uniref:Uncharacterized protein n=1 Tax=Brachionus plicatilis TaxID=10195 RepID=A0A3M7PHR1_BRAPC|nr:hypothetical protein BpHYR1_051089 [Brachionus plicatilis]
MSLALKKKLKDFFCQLLSKFIQFEANDFNDVNNFLEKYDLNAFQHRFLDRMLSLSFVRYSTSLVAAK